MPLYVFLSDCLSITVCPLLCVESVTDAYATLTDANCQMVNLPTVAHPVLPPDALREPVIRPGDTGRLRVIARRLPRLSVGWNRPLGVAGQVPPPESDDDERRRDSQQRHHLPVLDIEEWRIERRRDERLGAVGRPVETVPRMRLEPNASK